VDTNWADNTSTSSTARIPYSPAVKLKTSDIGRAAVDPLVPSGYK
jgi:hypothetical protein